MLGNGLAEYLTGRLVSQRVDFCWPTGLLVLRSEQPQVYVASCAHGVAGHVGVDVSKQADGSAKARSEHVHVCTDVPVAHSIYSFYLGYLVVP